MQKNKEKLRIFYNSQILPGEANKFHGISASIKKPSKSTTITDMPLELLLDIYEAFDLDDLINVAKSHPHSQIAAEIVFKKKYSIKKFTIKSKQINRAKFKPNYDIPIEFNKLLVTLKMFGHLITKLKINYNYFHEKQSELMNEYISKYVADSLVEIELKSCNDAEFKGFTRPLNNVEIVRLRHGHVKSNITNLSKIFRSVRRLDIRQMFALSPATIEHHYAELQEIKMEFMLAIDSPHLERRLRLNTQLCSLYISGCNWQALRMISEILPNLERIELTFDDKMEAQGGDIHFEKMKVFSMKLMQDLPDSMLRIPIVFGQLEEIVCIEPIGQWFDVIIQNKQLKKITVARFDNEQFQRIAEELSNLEEIHMTDYDIASSGDIDSVVRFIEMAKHLKRATFSNSNADICGTISERLPHDWMFMREKENLIFVHENSN